MIPIANDSQMIVNPLSLTRVWRASKPQFAIGAGDRAAGRFRGRVLPRRKFKTGLPKNVHG